jgi:UDP-N-acetylmuramoyl-tripeptide--D-alanyl-D-alanine ligase
MVVTSAATLARVCRGRILAGDATAMVASAVIDSREATSGCAFFAMPGARADGHDFVDAALCAGARVVVVSRGDEDVVTAFTRPGRRDSALVLVDDTAAALTALAAYNRSRLSCPVIAITGSSGKTTTKDFLKAALATSLTVVATEGNRNNELGVPLTVLRAGGECGAVVVEMAMRGRGQIADLCAVAKPTIALITNIGTSHIELLGSQEAIAATKGEVLGCLPETGRAFLNADDEWSARLAARCVAPVTYYGVAQPADVRADEVVTDDGGFVSLVLRTPEGEAPVTLPVPGRHNAYNAAAAAAIALYLGLNLIDVAAGLGRAAGSPMRMEVFETAQGVTIVNDAYNANPASMRAAVTTLADMAADGRRIAVLGDMAELGSFAELAHFRVGELLAASGIDLLVTVGPRARRIADGARAAGLSSDAISETEDASGATVVVSGLVDPGDVVLVKASRVMGLEAVVEGVTSTRCLGPPSSNCSSGIRPTRCCWPWSLP